MLFTSEFPSSEREHRPDQRFCLSQGIFFVTAGGTFIHFLMQQAPIGASCVGGTGLEAVHGNYQSVCSRILRTVPGNVMKEVLSVLKKDDTITLK